MGRVGPKAAIAAAITLALAGAVLTYAWMARPFYQRYWVDDAAISFTFVKNIAAGYGSVAAPGGERVEGFSNPTWLALLVAARKLGAEPFAASQALAYILALATLALLALFAWWPMPDGRRPWPVALATTYVALNASFVVWNQSGMENSLYGFLLTATMLLVVREGRDPEARPWSAPVLFLLAITRPEAVGQALPAGVFLLLTDLVERRRPSRRLFVWAGAFLALFGAYHLWHYLYFARPFPNTYYAKVRPAVGERLLDLRSSGWRYVTTYFARYGVTPLLWLAAPAFFGRRVWREALYFTMVAAYLFFFPLVAGGDWMKMWRFLSVAPIPLAMLLGLAAMNVAAIVRWAVATWGKREVAAAAVAIAVAVAYVGAATAATAKFSLEQQRDFARDREVSAKGTAKRVKWWGRIAERLAIDPADTTMCDMDMGGTSYNWPGRMLDIGYLLDVPMATHRYTSNWRRMMDRYFFTERRPEFIHIRRGWGQATTIPSNPKFGEQYLRLPEDRRFSSVPNGNFVRRDLFEIAATPTSQGEPIAFAGGVSLVAADVPRGARPRARVPLYFTWKRDRPIDGAMNFGVGLAKPGDEPFMVYYDPVMGWLPPAKWPGDKFEREAVWLRTPGETGRYEVYVAVKQGDAIEMHKLPTTIYVGEMAAEKAAVRLLKNAAKMAAGTTVDADRAAAELRRAEQIAGKTQVAPEVKKVQRRRLETYLDAAAAAMGEGSLRAAAYMLERGWRIDPRDERLNDLGWRVAKALYESGRGYQLRGEYGEAYADFDAACRAQPQDAWARRRAEEVRMKENSE